MNKLCRQVSIESPTASIKDCVVFNFEVPVPEVPPQGARIRVVCAGACYRVRSGSLSSVSSTQSGTTDIHHDGMRDGALFPGYEVSGVVDALGHNHTDSDTDTVNVGTRVVLCPDERTTTRTHGYTEYMVVDDTAQLIPVPDNVSLGVAATLPSGALLAQNAVIAAHAHVAALRKRRPHQPCRILIVGTGGLALWAIRIASYHFGTSEYKDNVHITIASLKDEGFKLATEIEQFNVIQWNEDLYESQLIERTRDACSGFVDIVIDFGTTSRSLHRSLHCLNTGGVVIMCEDVAERLTEKFSSILNEKNQRIEPVAVGNVEQLRSLLNLVSAGQIIPPPHEEFAADEASSVVQKLCHCKIQGRAILRFHDTQ